MKRRAWLPEEDEFLRRYFRCEGADVVAAVLQRTRSSVYGRVTKLGLATQVKFLTDQQITDAIVRFHPEGWSDTEIKNWLDAHWGLRTFRKRIGRIRKRLGLPSNAWSQHRIDATRVRTREQLEAAGFDSLSQLRRERFNQWKRSLGWPEHLSVRAVQSLEMFYRKGPMTRLQLCAALGIDKKRRLKRTEPTSSAKGGTVLAELHRAGLILRLPKSVPSGRDRRGGVRTVDLYMLSPGVLPDDETRIAETSGCRKPGSGASHDPGLANVSAASVLRRDHVRGCENDRAEAS